MKASKIDMSYFKPKEFLSRNSPITLVFVFAVILVIIGLIISALKALFWIGSVAILVYIIYFIIWLWMEKWW